MERRNRPARASRMVVVHGDAVGGRRTDDFDASRSLCTSAVGLVGLGETHVDDRKLTWPEHQLGGRAARVRLGIVPDGPPSTVPQGERRVSARGTGIASAIGELQPHDVGVNRVTLSGFGDLEFPARRRWGWRRLWRCRQGARWHVRTGVAPHGIDVRTPGRQQSSGQRGGKDGKALHASSL